ncbi:MAG: sulfatase [Deltaproteobacteria bacterium]|nr:sulfatase [Deltaproteobacteria bacterium]
MLAALSTRRFHLTLTVLALVGVAAGSAEAACGSQRAAMDFRAEIGARVRCERLRALGSGQTCAPAEECAEQVDRVAELVFGPSDLPIDRLRQPRAWRCQKRLSSAAKRFFIRRNRELLKGIRPSSFAARFVADVAESCADVPLTTPATGFRAAPAVGGACTPFSEPFDDEGAAYCLRGAFEEVAQEVTGVNVKPNILFVLTDDQRWDTLSVMPRTMDLVAGRGIEFTNAFNVTSLCCPDRASIFTGLYPRNHGVTSNGGAQMFDNFGADTIQRQLRSAGGYKTALLGKYLVFTGGVLGTQIPPGWDDWQVFMQNGNDGSKRLYFNYTLNENGTLVTYGASPEEYSTDLLGRRAIELMERWRGEPFFVEVALYAPHLAATPAPRHDGAFEGITPHRPPNHMEADISDKPKWVGTSRGLVALAGNEPGAMDRWRISQLETLLAVDEAVESLSDSLEELGLTDNTLLLFSSDNGYAWLEHWLTLKNYPYEEAIRIPQLLRYPKRVHAPVWRAELVQHIDLYPTFAELAGITSHPPVDGRSLVPLLGDDVVPWREEILIEHLSTAAFTDPSSGVRTHQWKYIETDADEGVVRELYDLVADPFELTNVYGDPANAAVVSDLQARLAILKAQ